MLLQEALCWVYFDLVTSMRWHTGLLADPRCSECHRGGALALDDRIKSLIIRPLCVLLHSLRHDLILVLVLAAASLQSQRRTAASFTQMGTQI